MLAARRSGESARRALSRHGLKVGIVALGAAVAAGTIARPAYLPHATIAHALIARDSSVAARPSALANAVAAAPAGAATTVAGGLDVGFDHPSIDNWVHRLTTSMSSTVSADLGRMSKYSAMISQKLAAKQMPHDLIYLAMIESEFNPSARSPVHAVGLWQFMSSTARRFGLTVRGSVDERKDPARATDAAVAYLSSLHDEFGSWYLAAAAYNSGEGTVARALKKITGKSEGTDADFFRILPALPKETRDYVPKLIATARIGNDPTKYGITPDTPAQLASESRPVAVPKRHASTTRKRATHVAVKHHAVRHTAKHHKRK